MSAVFVRTALRERPELFRRVVQFNLHPAATLHTEHLPQELHADVFRRICQTPRGERHLSQWVMTRFGLSPSGFWRFEYPPQRLAVLDSSALQRLVKFAGAAAHHQAIAATIGGAAMRDVKQFLGDDAYNFALKRAALVVGPKPLEEQPAEGPLSAQRVRQSGIGLLRACLGADSPELLRRTSLKLPAEWAISPETPAANVHRERCWKVLKRIVLTELSPELSPCFN